MNEHKAKLNELLGKAKGFFFRLYMTTCVAKPSMEPLK